MVHIMVYSHFMRHLNGFNGGLNGAKSRTIRLTKQFTRNYQLLLRMNCSLFIDRYHLQSSTLVLDIKAFIPFEIVDCDRKPEGE